jgi:hypothetical protein
MPQIIDVPGHGQVEFPDGMSDAQIVAAIKANAPQPANEAATRPEFNLPFGGSIKTSPNESGFNLPAFLLSGAQKVDSLSQGLRRAKLEAGGILYTALGMDKDAQMNAEAQAAQATEEAQKSKSFAQLQAVHPGSTELGGIAPLIPLGPTGMVAAAGMEYGTPQERATRMLLTAAGNKAAKYLGGVATKQYQGNAAQAALETSQNAEKDATLRAAQDAGFVVPPSTTNPTWLNQRIEGLSGKAATQQAVSGNNAKVADTIARQELGLAPGAAITENATRTVRKQAYQNGYAPVAQAGQLQVSPEFNPALDAITAKNTSASQSFPGAAAPDIKALVDSFRPPNGVFDAGHALETTQILRDGAREAFRNGENAVGQAKLALSKEIENEIERHLGGKVLQNFQAARQLMAKSHSVEDMIRTGSGSIEASKAGQMVQRGDYLSGGLKTMGDFANVFPKANQTSGAIGSPGVSKLEGALAGLMGTGGAALGGPAGGFAAASLPFVVPPAARALMLSKGYQKFMTRPEYSVNGLLGSKALDNELAPYISGLLGYQAASR